MGIKASLAGFCLGVFFLVLLGAYYVWENRRRDNVQAELPVSDNASEISRELKGDLTDWKIASFRYMI
jgi:hypothetical protein